MFARLIMAVALVGGFAAFHYVPASDPGIDTVTSASVPPHVGNEFTIANLTSRTACIAKRGRAVTSRSRAFVASSDCDAVWPGLTEVKNWTENEDGSVVLSNSKGEQVLTISEADGVAYEALDPPNAVVTLTVIR